MSKLYINDRKPKKGTFTDRSKLKIGRHSFANRLSFIKGLQFDWLGNFSGNYIRANLKWTFFTYWLSYYLIFWQIISNYDGSNLCTWRGDIKYTSYSTPPYLWLLKSSIIVIFDFMIVRWSLRRKYKYI